MRSVLLCAVLLGGCGDDLHAKPIDAAIDAPRSCATCNAATEYCYQIRAGVLPTVPVLGCNPLPAACAAAPTCPCVIADVDPCGGGALSCSQDASGITVSCDKP